jgi:hypothetical protein
MIDFIKQSGFSVVDFLFVIRVFPLILAGFVTTRSKNFTGFIICFLYICVTTVNYLYANAALNAVFSTPLVFITCWYLIRPDAHNKRNRRIKFVKKED